MVLPSKKQKKYKNKDKAINNCSHRRKFFLEARLMYVPDAPMIFEVSFLSILENFQLKLSLSLLFI